MLKQIQKELFELGADLATPPESKAQGVKRITAEHTKGLESTIARFEEELEPLHKFILPGGAPGAALLHICRAVCRRAERRVVELSKSEPINKECIVYLNRLSSLFFELARVINVRANVSEEEWNAK